MASFNNIGQTFCDLLASWGEALSDGLPNALREKTALSRPAIAVTVTGGGELELGAKNIARGSNIILNLPRHSVLRYQFWAPIDALGEVGHVAEIEAHRVMPLPAARLYLTHTATPHPEFDEVHIELAATHRHLVEAALQAARERDLTVVGISEATTGSSEPATFILPVFRHAFLLKVSSLTAGLLICLWLASLAPAHYLSRLKDETRGTAAAIIAARTAAAPIMDLQRERDAMNRLSLDLLQRQKQGGLLTFFVALTGASPDDVVITRLRLDGRQVFVSGEATAPEDWALALDNLALFEAVTLTSVDGDPGLARRQFDVEMRLTTTTVETGS